MLAMFPSLFNPQAFCECAAASTATLPHLQETAMVRPFHVDLLFAAAANVQYCVLVPSWRLFGCGAPHTH